MNFKIVKELVKECVEIHNQAYINCDNGKYHLSTKEDGEMIEIMFEYESKTIAKHRFYNDIDYQYCACLIVSSFVDAVRDTIITMNRARG